MLTQFPFLEIQSFHSSYSENLIKKNTHFTNLVFQSQKIIKIYFSQSRKFINNFIFRSEKSETLRVTLNGKMEDSGGLNPL